MALSDHLSILSDFSRICVFQVIFKQKKYNSTTTVHIWENSSRSNVTLNSEALPERSTSVVECNSIL